MIEPAWFLYVLALAILAYFWWQVRGCSFEDLLARSHVEHQAVKRVFAKHPHGGSWTQFKDWYAREAAASRRLESSAAPS